MRVQSAHSCAAASGVIEPTMQTQRYQAAGAPRTARCNAAQRDMSLSPKLDGGRDAKPGTSPASPLQTIGRRIAPSMRRRGVEATSLRRRPRFSTPRRARGSSKKSEILRTQTSHKIVFEMLQTRVSTKRIRVSSIAESKRRWNNNWIETHATRCGCGVSWRPVAEATADPLTDSRGGISMTDGCVTAITARP